MRLHILHVLNIYVTIKNINIILQKHFKTCEERRISEKLYMDHLNFKKRTQEHVQFFPHHKHALDM